MDKKSWIYIAILFVIVDLSKTILSYTHFHLISWDESVFLGMGKFIFSFGNIGLWENIRPMGLPFILGLMWKTGVDYILGGEIIAELFTFGSLAIIFLIGKKLYNKKIGFLAALITFLTPAFFGLSLRIMTGIPSLFFCLLALYLLMNKKHMWAGITCFIAFIFRYPSGLMAVALALILLYEHNKKRKQKYFKILKKEFWLKQFDNKPFIMFCASFSTLILLFLIANKFLYGSFLESLILASKHQSTFAGNVNGLNHITFYFVLIFSNLTLLFSIFTLSKDKDSKKYNLIIPFILFLLYFIIIPHKKERFAVLFIPYLAILASYGFYKSLENNTTKMYKFLGYLALVLMMIGAGVNCLATYSQFPTQRPEFISSYFEYFKDNESLVVLTCDPRPVAYSDAQFIPYYQNPQEANIIYDTNIGKVDAVIYTLSSFPWNDSNSIQQITMLEGKIKENRLEYEEEFWGQKIEIYRVR